MTELHLGAAADAGQCVARLDGRVVFVRGGLPTETVEATVTGQTKRFWRAEVTKVIAPSQHRVEAACPWFGRCGGCAWLHADLTEQLRIKADVLRQALLRIGGVDWPVSVRSLGRETGWRTRVTLQVDELGQAGFFRQASHDVVGVDHCLQAVPELALDEVLASNWAGVQRVQVSCSEAGRSVIGARRSGPRTHRHTVRGRTFERAVDGFWQSHVDAADVLAAAVCELAEPVERIVDLYAGVGLFGLTLLDAMPGAALTLVESDRQAARFARRNSAGRARVLTVDTREWRATACDLLVLDPPRAGAGRKVVRAIAAATPATVIYVSCDPATLARDLKTFAELGYRPDHVQGYDLFPGTAHVETVVRLRWGMTG